MASSSKEEFEFYEGGQKNEMTTSNPSHHSLLYKIVKTICIVLVWLCIGLWAEINGATLQDLMYITKSNYEVISRAISMRGAGGLAGAILGGGYIVDKFHSKVELIVALALVSCAALNAAVPYCKYIELLFAVYVVEGWMEVMVNIGGQVIIMDIWMERASSPLHLIHLGYGAGSFIAPQIVKNYISDALPERLLGERNPKCVEPPVDSPYFNGSYSNGSDYNLTTTLATTTLAPTPSETVQYGFFIISGVIIVIAIVWFLYFFFDRKDASTLTAQLQRPRARDIFNPNTCLPGHPRFVVAIYALMFAWIYVAVVGERTFAKYLYSFARMESCFSKDEAANILTAYWVSFTAGRFAGFVVANFIPMKFIIFIEGFGNLASALVLYFMHENKYALWVCVCVSGVLIGPCYPSGLAWANRYVMVTATGVTLLSVAAGVSDLTYLAVIGNAVQNIGIRTMIPFFLGFGVLACIMPILMQSTACTRGDRFENAETEHEED